MTALSQIIVKESLETAEIVVAAEKQVICVTSGGLLEASLYYPPSQKNLCIYFQKCILQIEDGKKLPTMVITSVNDIDNSQKIA